jgi:hypothetical protein
MFSQSSDDAHLRNPARAIGPLIRRSPVSKRLHVAAAAKQLNRNLFNNMPIEGGVVAGHDNLEVLVRGTWPKTKIATFAGYAVAWRECD